MNAEPVHVRDILRDTSRAAEIISTAPESHSRIVNSVAAGETQCVGHRIDWLAFGFKIPIVGPERRLLDRRADVARIEGRAELAMNGLSTELTRSKNSSIYPFRHKGGSVRGLLDLHADHGWNLSLLLGGEFLAQTLKIEDALTYARGIARAFGDPQGERLRRVDLCSDFTGFPLLEDDAHAFVRRKGGLSNFRPEFKDRDMRAADEPETDAPDRIMYRSLRDITGWTICAGNPLMCRIYDKSAELELPQREEKRKIEQITWRANGWPEGAQVTRVEFQIQGLALNEFRMRDPAKLAELVDPVWRYCTHAAWAPKHGGHGWLRLVDMSTSERRSRCETDPRWQAAQSVLFRHLVDPATRYRIRQGASFAQALGTTTSSLVRLGVLHAVSDGIRARAENVDLDDESLAHKYVLDTVREIFSSAAEHGASEILSRRSPVMAANSLRERINSTRARFSAPDRDMLAEPPPPCDQHRDGAPKDEPGDVFPSDHLDWRSDSTWIDAVSPEDDGR